MKTLKAYGAKRKSSDPEFAKGYESGVTPSEIIFSTGAASPQWDQPAYRTARS